MTDFSWRPCGYGCGKPWRPFAGTKLIGHALCAATPAHQDALLARLDATTRIRTLATEEGVSEGTMRAWINAALRRRSLRSTS